MPLLTTHEADPCLALRALEFLRSLKTLTSHVTIAPRLSTVANERVFVKLLLISEALILFPKNFLSETEQNAFKSLLRDRC